MDLNRIMEFEHVIRVHPDGSVSDVSSVYAPEIVVSLDDDRQITGEAEREMIAYAASQGWDLMTGYTSQHMSAHSPIMHPSEFISGSLADDILNRDGLYVACVVKGLGTDESDDDDNIGWVVARREITPEMVRADYAEEFPHCIVAYAQAPDYIGPFVPFASTYDCHRCGKPHGH